MSDGRSAPRPVAPGHETRDIDARRLGLLSAVLAALVVVAMAAMFWVFNHFAAREAARQPAGATMAARSEVRFPPEPRLQVSARDDLRRLRAEEDAILGGYGWSDREKGLVRIPIERAMEIVVERGLPARGEEAAP